jgi:hypothetical protein
MQGLNYIFYANTATVHALVRFKTFWRINLIQPQKLSIAVAAITFKLCVHYGKLLIAYSGIGYKPNTDHRVLTCHHYRPYICHPLALWLSCRLQSVLDNLSHQ